MLLHQLLLDGAHRAPDDLALHWVGSAPDGDRGGAERGGAERGGANRGGADRGGADRVLSYASAVEEMERAAGALAGLGVGPGDRVALVAGNSLEYVLAMFGAWRLGAVAALVSVAYTDQLAYYLADCDPTVVLYGSDVRAAVERHRAAARSLRYLVCLDGDGDRDGALSWPSLAATASRAPAPVVAEGDVAHLSYTSGTSGPPKGACLAHEPTARATRCIAERLRLEPGEVCYGPTALSSSYQLVANLLPGLHRGAEVCIASRWPGGLVGWRDLERVGTAVVAANPVVLTDILTESRARGRSPGALRLGVSGGGPVPPGLKRAWRDELHVTLAESFGQSELGGFFGLGGPEAFPDRLLAACGRPLPDKEVRIVDDGGREVAVGELGEIVLRGGFMTGYWRRPDKTAETLGGGWLHSGDVGFVDREGYLYMRGRLSERLTVAGRHWYPRDVEEALLGHPAVTAAALIGLPDEQLGQRPVAYVTVTAGAPVGGAGDDGGAGGAGGPGEDGGAGGAGAGGAGVGGAGVAGLAEAVRVALGECPPGLEVRIVDAMPMTPTGKISKAQLLERAHPS